jgi:hypothetical protein
MAENRNFYTVFYEILPHEIENYFGDGAKSQTDRQIIQVDGQMVAATR